MSKSINHPVDQYMKSIDNENHLMSPSSWASMESMLDTAEATPITDTSTLPESSTLFTPYFSKILLWIVFIPLGIWSSYYLSPAALSSKVMDDVILIEDHGNNQQEDNHQESTLKAEQPNDRIEYSTNKQKFHLLQSGPDEQSAPQVENAIISPDSQDKIVKETIDEPMYKETQNTPSKVLPLDTLPLGDQIKRLAKPNQDTLVPPKKKFLFW